jgi:hypothetical protein
MTDGNHLGKVNKGQILIAVNLETHTKTLCSCNEADDQREKFPSVDTLNCRRTSIGIH